MCPFLDYSMAFNTASQCVFAVKLGGHQLQGEITRRVENLLKQWSEVHLSNWLLIPNKMS